MKKHQRYFVNHKLLKIEKERNKGIKRNSCEKALRLKEEASEKV